MYACTRCIGNMHILQIKITSTVCRLPIHMLTQLLPPWLCKHQKSSNYANGSSNLFDPNIDKATIHRHFLRTFCCSKKMNLKAKIGPSVLNSDLANLTAESQKLLDNGADYLHLDVMDGNFVPNLTFGHPVVKSLRKKIKNAYFETHMMVNNPEQWIAPMADAGVNLYTFHIEPVENVSKVCRLVQESGMQVGLAIKPGTEVKELCRYIEVADVVLVMTVEPGFGGQSFMADMMPKVEWLRSNYPNLDIEVDGGVSPSTIECCAKSGANMIVSGTAVIGAPDQRKVINELREVVQKYLK